MTDDDKHRALDPAIAEQAVEVLEGVTPGPWVYEYTGIGHTVRQPGAYNAIFTVNHAGNFEQDARFIAWCRESVPALLAQIAALRAEVRKSAMDAVSAGCQAQEAYEAQKAAEAERDALRAERGAVLGMYMRSSDEGFRQKARAEAAETTLAAMTKERDAKVATDAVEQMIRNLRDCANGMGSFKTNRGDFGLCDDAADMISAIAAHRDALNILSAEDVAVHQEAISRAEAAEAEVEKLRTERDEHRRNWERAFDADTALEEGLTAAEAVAEKLRGALVDLTAAFAKKVDVNRTKWRMSYEHPLSAYDRAMDLLAALTTEDKT